MSAITLPPSSGIPSFPVQKLSVAKYHQMIQSGAYTEEDRVELIEGFIVPKMPHNPPHDGTVQNVNKKVSRRLPGGWDTRVQSSITLADSEPEPDIAVARGDETSYFTRHPEPPDIGMLVEVSDSTLAFDRNEKGRIYARASISIYWIVNLVDRIIEVYTRPSGPTAAPSYASRQDYHRGDSVPLILDGVLIASIPVADLLP